MCKIEWFAASDADFIDDDRRNFESYRQTTSTSSSTAPAADVIDDVIKPTTSGEYEM